ncbi:MAG TPA: T9SS type A sorting domain-containing protein [Ignavibacteria bacterium]|nr:T9SS type A sorting domain-containing protein [Ignavibacteria bacterium]
MKHLITILFLFVFCSGVTFAQPRAKIVTQYVTPQMLASTPGLTQDSTVSSGLNTVAKGTFVYLRAWNWGDTSSITNANWTLTQKPAGSSASISTITGLSWWAKFKADLTGTYEISVSMTTTTGTRDTITKIYASTYVGTGGFDNVAAQYPNCMSCHGSTPKFQDIFNRWKDSKHATTFKTNITSGPSSYGINQFKLHTLGYDHNIFAENNGFDDKARQLGWVWSSFSPPKPANWDSLKNRFSQLVAFANVGCESCHGAGSEHVLGGGDTMKIQKSVDEGNCGKCHDASASTPQFAQFKNSLHSDVIWSSSFAQNNNGTNNLDNCIRCHDGNGYVNYTKGVGTNTNGFTKAKQEMIACASCHDPHGNSNQFSLRNRPSNADTLANGFHYTNVGNGIVCMDCHKSRKNSLTYVNTRVTSSTWGPHHSGQTDVYQGQNAAMFAGPYQSTAHKEFLVGACVRCHMAPTDTLNPANRNKVGDHSMSMHNPETNFDNLSGCQTCHFGKTRFDQFIAPQDYDGNGLTEAWQKEIDGCLKNLRLQLPPVGVDSVAWQLVAADSNNVTLRKAYFNYLLIYEDGSRGMHNPKFAVDVLLKSRNALVGIMPVSTEIPLRYEMSQNYPNPFNPVTKFNISIAKAGNVKIVVYDITGREVTVLLNNVLNPGTYNVEWNATNSSGRSVSSGVYFYKIAAGSFVDVKKMMLIK